VVIAIQDIMGLVAELVTAVMAEGMVVLRGRRRLTFREADGREDMGEDTIMALEVVVDMVGEVIQGTVLITPRGRYSCDAMEVVAVVVDVV
jgi:predicted aconitase with swiveling domain